MIKHSVDLDKNNNACITLLEGDFADATFTFGKVEIKQTEDGNGATLSFEYNVVKGVEEGNKEFEAVIGDLLADLITDVLDKREIVYSAGTVS